MGVEWPEKTGGEENPGTAGVEGMVLSVFLPLSLWRKRTMLEFDGSLSNGRNGLTCVKHYSPGHRSRPDSI